MNKANIHNEKYLMFKAAGGRESFSMKVGDDDAAGGGGGARAADGDAGEAGA